MMYRTLSIAMMLVALPLPSAAQAGGGAVRPVSRQSIANMVVVPAGRFRPLYRMDGDATEVSAFAIDRLPVTRARFEAFVRANPRWQRGVVPVVFAEAGYLHDWASPTDAGTGEDRRRPVVNVSWFAAKSYCEWVGGRLPTTDEWELVARADSFRRDASSDTDFRRELLEMYARPRIGLPAPVGAGMRNVYGVGDLHDGVWEWVLDFGGAFNSADSRATGGRDRQLYCAAGANGAPDTGDYAAFMRYSFRSTLRGASVIQVLGFRCAADIDGRGAVALSAGRAP
jgi:formylglycine-generating enzyme required for sulfatase activity